MRPTAAFGVRKSRVLAHRAVTTPASIPYWRLAGIYLAYFAFVGAFAPYFGLYLRAIEQSAWQIGVLLSLVPLMRMTVQYSWAALADRSGWRARLLCITLAAAVVAYLGVFATTSFAGLLVVLAAFAFFSSATMPLMESITLTALQGRVERYGGIRLWGSLGFIAAVLGVGWVLDRAPIATLLWLILAALAASTAFAFTLRDRPAPARAPHEPLWRDLMRPEVVALLAANFCMSFAHGPLYAFFSIYLADANYSKTAIGALWTLGVAAEIGVFLAAPALLKRYSEHAILCISFALAIARFALIGWGIDSPALLVAAQLAHAATFGACHMASVALMSRWFSGARQVRGQAIYLSVSFGAGGFLGAIASGAAWEAVGPAWTYTGASVAAALGLLLLVHRGGQFRRVARADAHATAH
jgi:PPP family 3-phenylpropionic acid transporter